MAVSEDAQDPAYAGKAYTEAEMSARGCALEGLPPEVRRHILLMLDLPQLKAVVQASPSYHAQYILERDKFLFQSIQATLGSIAVDAYAIQLLELFVYGDGTFREWYANKTLQRSMSLADTNEWVSLQRIAETYFRCVKIRELFAQEMLKELADIETDVKPAHVHQKKEGLSRTEEMRLTRAIYRFELLCHFTDSVNPSFRLELQRPHELLALLEPWEIEELFIFYKYAQAIYDKILDDIRWDIHPNNPKFDDQGRPTTPYGAFDLDNGEERAALLEGATMRGVDLLHTVLFQTSDRERLVSLMQEHMRISYVSMNDSTGLLGETRQSLQREFHTSERDLFQETRFPLPFRGDDDPSAPPLAWTLIWKDTYSNLYGCYIPDEIRRWGYVFWDATTLESTGSKETLKLQWEEFNVGEDPRDHLS